MQAAAAAFGLQLDGDGPTPPPEPPAFHLWPENVPAWLVWLGVQTQWRSGMGGREGLDYAAVDVQLRTLGVRPKDRRRRWAEIQLMERTALRVWSQRQAAAAAKG